MTDFNAIDDDELVPDAPGTSLLMFRLRDNPVAIAEGAANAPRIALKARKGLPMVTANGNSPAAVIGLGDLDFVTMIFQFQGGSALSGDAQVSFTNDGVNWGGWLAFIGSVPAGAIVACVMHYDRPTGSLIVGAAQNVEMAGGGSWTTAINLAPGASAQGFRIRCGTGVAGWVNRLAIINAGVA